ncbi:MAG: D-sedoheptulose 7-phosphate isomerase [Thermodesulfobacteriota bacterium]|nr:D-sedoheptulose 7-phosphate isomerase [Thermodesulfobacteriota bacterium]
MKEVIFRRIRESVDQKMRFFEENLEKIEYVAELIAEAFRMGDKLLIIGNGGSAADAQHMAAEFVNRYHFDRPPLPALALSTDTSVITSIGNDFDFSSIFSKQIKALGKERDILLAISTSGNSPNVIEGVETATKMGIKTVGLLGGTGGKMARLIEYPLIVPSKNTPTIQEVHITTVHTICELVENKLFRFT